MVDINLECVRLIEPEATRSADLKGLKDTYLEAVRILLVLLENVLSQPDNPKFRTIRLENKAIKEKLMSLPGCEKLLTAIGFTRSPGSSAFTLPNEVSMQQVQKYRDALQERRSAWLSGALPEAERKGSSLFNRFLLIQASFIDRSSAAKSPIQSEIATVY